MSLKEIFAAFAIVAVIGALSRPVTAGERIGIVCGIALGLLGEFTLMGFRAARKE